MFRISSLKMVISGGTSPQNSELGMPPHPHPPGGDAHANATVYAVTPLCRLKSCSVHASWNIIPEYFMAMQTDPCKIWRNVMAVDCSGNFVKYLSLSVWERWCGMCNMS